MASRGTYVEVAETLAAEGFTARFVVGSDKLGQLEDPSFYPDGQAGVARTFARVDFIVVPRPDALTHRPELRWLEVGEVFERSGDEALSATEVRRRVRAGESVEGLVPQAVVLALRGYTSLK
jgi:nicotinic acid mononucleotide adenylyltransferase